MPSLDKLNSTYKDKGLVVVSVSLNNSVNRVKDFLEKVPVGFIVLLDEKSKVSRQYKVYSIPTTFVIDKGGFVVRKYQGPEDWISPKITKTMEDLLR
jgi:peroxiredoxin